MPKKRPFYWPPTWPYWGRGGGGGSSRSGGAPTPSPPTPPVPPVPPVDPLSIFDDQFDLGLINPLWQVLRPELVTVNEIIDGIWHVGAATGGPGGSFWFNAFTGWLWGPQIPGDALMQSRVMIRNLAGDGPPPVSEYRLGGEGVHDPVFPPENYDHDVVGYLVPEAGPGPRIELKNNQNSVSNYITFPWSDINAWIDLAMQYVGQICTFAAKLSTEPDYTVYRIIDRNVDGPPMPNTKWWGLKTYSNDATADVSLLVDRVLFSTPGFNGGLILPTS